MEMNRDDAAKCAQIGKRELSSNNLDKALRFITKANSLYPCAEYEQLLVDVNDARKHAGTSGRAEGAGDAAHRANGHAGHAGPQPSHAPQSSHRPAGGGGGPHAGPASNGHGHAHHAPPRHENGGGAAAGPSSAAPAAEGPRHRPAASGPSSSSAGPSTGPSSGASSGRPAATPEQIALVRRIRATKDYYEILGVPRDASEDDIKRAYKKLALKMHPDKCKAPGAEEAFKSVSKAVACLSEANARAHYDRFGSDDPRQRPGGFGGGGAGGQHPFADEFDPNEIFNMFFGMGGPFAGMAGGGAGGPNVRIFRNGFPAGGHRAPPGARGPAGEQAAPAARNPLTSLLQLLPLLMLFAFTFFNTHSESAYALSPNASFKAPRATARYEVPYYVKDVSAFERQYPAYTSSRQYLETGIEREYQELMKERCYKEEWQKRMHVRRQGEPMATPACDALKELGKKARGGFYGRRL